MILNDFKNNLVKNIQESNLPIDAIYFVMKDIMNEVINTYNSVLEQKKNAAETAAQSETEQEPISKEADASAQTKEEEK